MQRLRGFRRRFRFPWRTAWQIRRDVDDEIAFHLAEKTEALERQGLAPDEAREEALRQFGDVATARERLVDDDRRGERRSRWRTLADDFFRDARHAWRTLRRSMGFTAVAVLVLALGIGVVATMFSLVKVLALEPALMDEPDRVLAVYSQNIQAPETDGYRGFSYAEFEALRRDNHVFSDLAAWYFDVAGAEGSDVTQRVALNFVSAGYFETLGVPPARGRAFTRAEERGESPATAVVSHQYWTRTGRNPGMLGSTIRINGQLLVVAGIAAEGFTGTNALLATDVWVPLAFIERFRTTDPRRRLQEPTYRPLMLFGRMRDGVEPPAVDGELEVLAGRIDANLPSADGARFTYVATQMPRMTVSTAPDDESEFRDLGVLLMGMGAVVLLIATLNLANTFLARGAGRRTELAIRHSLGSGRARLVRQLLTECLILSLIGGVVGLLGSYWIVQWIAASMAVVIPWDMVIVLDVRPDLQVLLVTAGTCIVATLLFGLGPALRVTGRHLLAGLKESSAAGAPARRRPMLRAFAPRNLLLVAQIALSLVMLTAGGLFVRAALNASDATPGFRLDSSVLVELDASLAGYDEPRAREVYARVLERLRALPGVESAALTSQVPFSGLTHGTSVQPAGRPRGEDVAFAHRYVVGDGYFETIRLPLLRGRGFTVAEAAFETDRRVAIVSEPLARQLFGERDALGRSLQFASRDPDAAPVSVEIVGVAPGVRQSLQDDGPSRIVYQPAGRAFVPNIYMHLHLDEEVADAGALLDTVRDEIRRGDSALPVLTLTSLRGFVDENWMLWFVRLGGQIFTWLGVAALFMALVGIHGVTAFLTARRTREIGVRIALGATRAKVTRQIVRESLGVTLFGLVLGLMLASAVARLLASMLFEVDALDPLVFAGATAFLAAAATLASYLPVRRASRIEPTIALRYE